MPERRKLQIVPPPKARAKRETIKTATRYGMQQQQ
jgi:hypothetical protein